LTSGNCTLLDTGPLVAFLNRRDCFHDWTVARMGELEPPFLTCESVVSEACFLLRATPAGPEAVLTLVERGLIWVESAFPLDKEATALRELIGRYSKLPMSFADACLVRLSEQYPGARVFTLDRDFLVYRRNRRAVIPTLMPD
jgi:predicted nucleic acid-binding protein